MTGRATPVLWAVLAIAVLQATMIVTVPPFRGSDEIDHVHRAAAVAGGQWGPGPAPEGERGWFVEVPTSMVEAASTRCDQLRDGSPARCIGTEAGPDTTNIVTTAGNYPPYYYVAVGWVVTMADGASAVYAMRTLTGLVCLFLLGLAVMAAVHIRSRWLLASVLLTLTPTAVYSTISVAPNGIEIAAGVALWACLLALTDERSTAPRRLVLGCIVSAFLMAGLRLLGPAFVATIVGFTVVLRWPDRRRIRAILPWPWVGFGIVAVSAAAYAQFWWLNSSFQVPGNSSPDGPELTGQILAVSAIFLWPLQAISAFPYRNEVRPAATLLVLALIIYLVLLRALTRSPSRERVLLGLLIAGGLLLPVVATLATNSGRGIIWQGRYGLPLLAGCLLVAGWLLDRSRVRLTSRMVAVVVGLVSLSFWMALYAFLDFEVGSYGEAPAWLAPSAWALFPAVAVAGLLCARAMISVPDHEHDPT